MRNLDSLNSKLNLVMESQILLQWLKSLKLRITSNRSDSFLFGVKEK